MNDIYQTRQFFNMKHSELKQIIKEEIRNVLNEVTDSEMDSAYGELYKRATGEERPTGPSKNKFREVFLPNISGSPSSLRIDSIEKYKQYLQDFRKKYGEEPDFDKSIPDRWLITNPKYLEKKKIYDAAYSGFGTKGD